jgi:quinone-modifying oxidoreductase subunit QmoC
MSNRVKVNADLQFVEGVLSSGGQDLKKCYQCSTCTVACPLTPEGAPFPRKEMITAQWGIKDKLLGSMDSWLCFHCNDCSDQCPRGAKPGDVMAAIRNMSIKHFATPSVVGNLTTSLGGVLFLLLIPMLIIGGVIFAVHGGDFSSFMNADQIVFQNMLPITFVDIIFVSTALFAVFCIYSSLRKFLNALQAAYPKGEGGESLGDAIKGAITDIITHKQFKECGVNQSRNLAHMLVFYGFVGLAITTACVVPIHYGHVFGLWEMDTPLNFWNPVKILGNVSGLAAIVGIIMIYTRRLNSTVVGTSVSFDWTFIIIVLLIIATGFLAQITRVADMRPLAFIIYYCHLVFIFFLFAYAPNSKMAHMFYRTAALIYARYSGRSKSMGFNQLEDKTEAAS